MNWEMRRPGIEPGARRIVLKTYQDGNDGFYH